MGPDPKPVVSNELSEQVKKWLQGRVGCYMIVRYNEEAIIKQRLYEEVSLIKRYLLGRNEKPFREIILLPTLNLIWRNK